MKLDRNRRLAVCAAGLVPVFTAWNPLHVSDGVRGFAAGVLIGVALVFLRRSKCQPSGRPSLPF